MSAERFVTSSDVFTPTPIEKPPPDVETPMPKPDFFVSLDEARSSAPGVTFTSRAAESSRSRPAETSEPRMSTSPPVAVTTTSVPAVSPEATLTTDERRSSRFSEPHTETNPPPEPTNSPLFLRSALEEWRSSAPTIATPSPVTPSAPPAESSDPEIAARPPAER